MTANLEPYVSWSSLAVSLEAHLGQFGITFVEYDAERHGFNAHHESGAGGLILLPSNMPKRGYHPDDTDELLDFLSDNFGAFVEFVEEEEDF